MRGRGMEGKAPEAILLSVPQMPVAITRTSTSSAPTFGSGTSATSSGSENRLRTAALMAESYQPLGGSAFHSTEPQFPPPSRGSGRGGKIQPQFPPPRGGQGEGGRFNLSSLPPRGGGPGRGGKTQ